MSRRIRIGISCNVLRYPSSGPFTDYRRTYVNEDYVRSVAAAGALPVLLPVNNLADPGEYLDLVDGLILSGGHDICPSHYGQEELPLLGETFPERDTFDMHLFKEAVRRDMPIFGICRGFQIINVSLGGKMLQDLSYSETPLLAHSQSRIPHEATHQVDFVAGSHFAELLGPTRMVNSFHHQVVTQVGQGLKIVARATDGTIEAVEGETSDIRATQWHPEMMSAHHEEAALIFKDFVDHVSRKVSARQ